MHSCLRGWYVSFLDCNGNEIISGEDENGRLESAHSFGMKKLGLGLNIHERIVRSRKNRIFTLDGKYRFPVSMKN